jgi:hypothetical protein
MPPQADETVRVVYDPDKIVIARLQRFSMLKETLDSCFDSCNLSILGMAIIRSALVQLKERGVRLRLITNITKENLEDCKCLMKIFDLRHLGATLGNFEIGDGREIMICSSVKEANAPRQQIISNIIGLVDLYQFPFNLLWNQAIAADLRIKEIEEGIPAEKTEIVRGTENIVRSQVEGLSKAKLSVDACCDRTFPASLVLSEQVWDMCSIFYSRGIKTRIITEITQDNIEYCAKMATRMNLRHLDTISGNFSIIDGKEYRGTAAMREGQPPTEGIFSTASVFVKEQVYLFETLWNKSIPAKQRIREIKEGTKREFVESIRDPVEIQRTGHALIVSAKEEILIMFSSAIAFHHQESGGILLKLKDELLSSALLRGVKIRILVPMDDKIRNKTAQELKDIGIDIRNYKKDALVRSELTTLLVDSTYVLSMELEGNPAERIEEVTGLATYSNSESAFLTYASIFETLWMQKQ